MSLLALGHCSNCWEFNSYDRTHCHHCDEVLPWAFLIAPSLEEKMAEEGVSLWARLAGKRPEPAPNFNPKPKHQVPCRYCGEPIFYDAKVCFHCHTLLATGSGFRDSQWLGVLFDSDAPKLSALIDAYIERQQPI